MTLPKTRYPTKKYMETEDNRNRCLWFYTNSMKLRADRNNQTIKIRKIRNGCHYVEITS